MLHFSNLNGKLCSVGTKLFGPFSVLTALPGMCKHGPDIVVTLWKLLFSLLKAFVSYDSHQPAGARRDQRTLTSTSLLQLSYVPSLLEVF